MLPSICSLRRLRSSSPYGSCAPSLAASIPSPSRPCLAPIRTSPWTPWTSGSIPAPLLPVRLAVDAIPLLVRSAGVKNYLFHWITHLRRLLGEDRVRLFPFLDRLAD